MAFMINSALVIILLFCSIYDAESSLAASLLERTDEYKYNINFLDVNEKIPTYATGTEVIVTSPANKQKYKCMLPREPSSEQDSNDDAKPIPKITDLLEPLGSTCLYRLSGWWTYEFCYGKHIRQYHQEKDQPIRPQDEFVLGSQTEADRLKLKEEEPVLQEHKDYYAEMYAHGTPCDITGMPRTSEIRYYCSADKATTMISDIKEPASCTYTISVITPLICNHPHFAPKKDKLLDVFCELEGELKARKVTDDDDYQETIVHKPPKKQHVKEDTTAQNAEETIVVHAEDLSVEVLTHLLEQAEANQLNPLEQQFVEIVTQNIAQNTAVDEEEEEEEEEDTTEGKQPTKKAVGDIKAATKKLQQKFSETKQKAEQETQKRSRFVKQPQPGTGNRPVQ